MHGITFLPLTKVFHLSFFCDGNGFGKRLWTRKRNDSSNLNGRWLGLWYMWQGLHCGVLWDSNWRKQLMFLRASPTAQKCVRPWGSWNSKAVGCWVSSSQQEMGWMREVYMGRDRKYPLYSESQIHHKWVFCLADKKRFLARPGSGPHGWEVRPSRLESTLSLGCCSWLSRTSASWDPFPLTWMPVDSGAFGRARCTFSFLLI